MELRARCDICGDVGKYELSEKEYIDIINYEEGNLKGYLQDLFPNIPNWIRAGTIDVRGGGFCICPKCSGFESEV